jgi:DNA mismatch endonuclease (patch repair protein)
MPKANREYWEVKIAENRTRDIRNTSQLEAAGWTVLRLWEHLDPEDGAAMVERALADS